jgi:cyclic pyranopterin phosphate synthase
MASERLSHLDDEGRVRMVDVGGKEVTARSALAEGEIGMEPATLAAVLAGESAKGNVLAVARVAAIGGAKRTADIVPLCHPLPLDAVEVDIDADETLPGLRIRVRAAARARTGVEMEALCGVAAGLLAVYDMCKGVDRGMRIGPIRLIEKRGGASGTWRR